MKLAEGCYVTQKREAGKRKRKSGMFSDHNSVFTARSVALHAVVPPADQWRDLNWPNHRTWALNWTEKWRSLLSTFIEFIQLNLFGPNRISLNLIASSVQCVALLRLEEEQLHLAAAYEKTEFHFPSSAGLKKLCGKHSRFGLLLFTLKKKHCTFPCLIFPVLPRSSPRRGERKHKPMPYKQVCRRIRNKVQHHLHKQGNKTQQKAEMVKTCKSPVKKKSPILLSSRF